MVHARAHLPGPSPLASAPQKPLGLNDNLQRCAVPGFVVHRSADGAEKGPHSLPSPTRTRTTMRLHGVRPDIVHIVVATFTPASTHVPRYFTQYWT